MKEWIFLLAGIIEFMLPVGIALYVRKKFSVPWMVFFIGAFMFLLSLIRIPLNMLAQNTLDKYFFGTALIVAVALVLSLTAGLFEEGCRYLGYRYIFRPDSRDWQHGLMYGAGHGGVEAILLVSSSHILIALMLLFAPAFLPPASAAEISSMPAYMPLVATLERVFALCVQIGLSIVVLQCFVRNSRKYLVAAVGFHAALDFFVVIAVQKSVFLAEAIAFIFAVIALYFIWRFREAPS